MSENHRLLSFCLSLVTSDNLEGNFSLSEEVREVEPSGHQSKMNQDKNGPSFSQSPIVQENAIIKPCSKSERKKIFHCNFEDCGKLFEQKWILDRHVTSHFPFRHFRCDFEGCKKAYKSKENLILHQKNKHLGLKPYQCRFCSLKFSHRNGSSYLI